MTLIVARKFADAVHLAADSLVTGGNQDLRQPDYALKVFALDNNTVVSYSGSPEVAHGVLGKVARNNRGNDIAKIADTLAAEQSSIIRQIGACQLEFLIAQRGRIFVVRDAEVNSDLLHAWIGDHVAFSAFQRCGDSIERPDGPIGAIAGGAIVRTVLEMVVQDPSIETVGGPVVSITSTESVTRYDCLMNLTSPKYTPIQGSWQSIDFGDAAQGGFGFTTVVPPKTGISGWGIFYFQAFKGVYFSADLSTQQFDQLSGNAKNAKHFCELLEPKLGYRPEVCGQLG